MTRSVATILLGRASGFRLTPTPLIMAWEVTTSCNSRCDYCGFWAAPPDASADLTTREAQRIIREARQLGVAGLVITGGEPLLRPDLDEILPFAQDLGLFVSVTTNGLLLDRWQHRLCRSCDHLTVSIDSITPADYHRRRGVDGFEHVLDSLLQIRAVPSAPLLHVQAVIDESNWREIGSISAFYYRLGVDVVFQLIHGAGFTIDRRVWQELVRNLRFRTPGLGRIERRFLDLFPTVASGRGGSSPCLALASNFVVSPSGKLLACNYQREPVADLRQTSLQHAWPKLAAQRRGFASSRRGCTCANSCLTIPAMMLT